MNLKVIIIDDEPPARELLKEHLSKIKNVEVVDECADGYEALKSIRQHHPDVVLLDIHMPKLNGFELLEVLETLPFVIFITAYDQYAIKAFEAGAIDYLLKPASLERLEKALQKVTENAKTGAEKNTQKLDQLKSQSGKHEEEGKRIVVKNGNAIRMVATDDIQYLEAYDDYVKLHLSHEFLLKKQTMNYFEEVLDPAQFVRVHRSFILQLKELNKIEALDKDSYIAILKSGVKLPVSRNGYEKLKKVLKW